MHWISKMLRTIKKVKKYWFLFSQNKVENCGSKGAEGPSKQATGNTSVYTVKPGAW